MRKFTYKTACTNFTLGLLSGRSWIFIDFCTLFVMKPSPSNLAGDCCVTPALYLYIHCSRLYQVLDDHKYAAMCLCEFDGENLHVPPPFAAKLLSCGGRGSELRTPQPRARLRPERGTEAAGLLLYGAC